MGRYELINQLKVNTEYIKITNGIIITPYRVVKGAELLIREGKIEEISEGRIDVDDVTEINAGGNFVAPGFIDIHVHGGGGADFMDNDVDAYLKVAETHARYGTTSMVPTTLTSGKSDLLTTLATYAKAKELNRKGSTFLGVHIEGPYFAMAQRGAQDPRYIRDPDPAEYLEILEASSDIMRWSAAPERRGALEFGRVLRSYGVLPSIAHTDAIYGDVVEALENGYTLATHFYSAMLGVTRKDAFRFGGAVEAGYVLDEMDVEIIADGCHLPAELLKLVYRTKGADRIALITDAMRGAALPEGRSILGSLHDGLEVVIEGGVAKLPDRTAFAGSVATADRLVRTMVQLGEAPLTDAVRMATATPARILGLSDYKGILAKGKDADIVIFDEQINVKYTLVKGREIYRSEREYAVE